MMLMVKANQLGRQIDRVGVDRPELKLFQDVFAKGIKRPVIGRIPIETLSGHGIDVIDDQIHIPLGEEFEGRTFWKDLPEKRVDVLHATLLRGSHRVAVIDTAPFKTMDTGLQGLRIAKLSAPVCENDLKQRKKIKGTETFLQAIENDLYSAFGTVVHKKSEEELFFGEIEGQERLPGVVGGMDSIHLAETLGRKVTEIGVKPPGEDRTISDLGVMDLPDLELHLSLEIDVPCAEKAHIDIVIKRAHGHIQLGMINEDLIRRLALKDEGSDDGVLFMKIMFGHVDTCSGFFQRFPVFAIRKDRVIAVLLCDRAFTDTLVTAITDERGFVESAAALFDKVFAGLVAGRTGMTFHTAEDDLAAGIGLMAVIALHTEVLFIDERTFMVPVGVAMQFDLLGDGSRILAEEAGDILQ